MRKFVILLIVANIFILAMLLMAVFFSWGNTYETFTAQILTFLRQPQKIQKFRILFPPARFSLFRYLLLFSGIFHIAAMVFVFRQRKRIVLFGKEKVCEFIQITSVFFQPLFSLSLSQKIVLLVFMGIWLLSRLYFLFQLPFHIDERFTYLYFVKPGWGVSMAYYPNPNNHILYTLLCNAAHVFIQNPVWVMKMPAFITGTLFPVLFFLIIRRFFDFSTAFPAVLFTSFNTQIYYYSLQGRGYILLILCVAIAAGCLLKLKEKESFWLYLFFIGVCVAGHYTIPVFVYPFAGMVAYGCIITWKKSRQSLIRLGLSVGLVLWITFILYLPVLLFNGWDAVTGNSWVKSLPLITYLQQFPESIETIAEVVWFDIPFSRWLVGMQLMGFAFYCFYPGGNKNTKSWLGVSLAIWLVLLPVLLWQRPTIYQRVFVYLWIFQGVGWAVFLQDFIRQKTVIILAAALLAGFTFYQIYKIAYPEKTAFYTSADKVAQLLFSQKANNLYFNTYEYSLCTRFLYETSDKNINISVRQSDKNSGFDYLILEKSTIQADTTGFKKIYDDELVRVFRK